MGRITLPFRVKLQEEIERLKRTFQSALIDLSRRDAFDSLVKAWTAEQGAMSYADVPTTLDIMHLTANVDNRKLIEEIRDEIAALETKVNKILKELEERGY